MPGMVLKSRAAARNGSSPRLTSRSMSAICVQRVDMPQVQLEHEAVMRADASAQGFEQFFGAGLDARGHTGQPADRARCAHR
jgi:hypothetical protein